MDAWQYPDPIPDFELVDQDGAKIHLSELGAGFVFVGFAFSSCQAVKACPTTMRKMREVQQLWLERSETATTAGRGLRLLTCTLDPQNDSPAVLKAYGRANQADFATWTLATGPVGLMEEGLPSLFGVLAMRDARGTLEHGVKAALLAPGLRSIREWTDNDLEPADVLAAIDAWDAANPSGGGR